MTVQSQPCPLNARISSNSVNSIFEDGQQRLWLCTNENDSDLYRERPTTSKTFDVQNSGLASNVVYNICELSADRLLVTTDKGFSILDYSKRYSKLQPVAPQAASMRMQFESRTGNFIGGTSEPSRSTKRTWSRHHALYNILPSRLTINGKAVSVADESGCWSKTSVLPNQSPWKQGKMYSA